MKKILFIICFMAIVGVEVNAQSWVPVGNPEGITAGLGSYQCMTFYNDTLYVAYQDTYGGGLNVLKYNGINWEHIGEPSFGNTGKDLSLAINNDTAYLAFSERISGTYKTSVMKFDGTEWVYVGEPGFSSTTSYDQSLAINNGTLYVAARVGERADVMKFNGTEWVNVGLPRFSEGTTNDTNLSIDSDMLYVAFEDGANNNGISVMKFNGTEWVYVGSAGFSGPATTPKMVIENQVLYVAFRDFTNSKRLSVMKFDGTDWVYVGTPGFADQAPSDLTIENGMPYVAFQEEANGFLATVMKFDGTNWVNVGDGGFSDNYPYYMKLVVGNGTPYVAYQEYGNGRTIVMKYGYADVEKEYQTITVNAIPDQSITSGPITVNAGADSGLDVVLSIEGPATIVDNTITLTGTTGIVRVTANQEGNDEYYPAPPVKVSFNVNKINQTITLYEIADKKVNSDPITVTATASSELPVTLSVEGPATINGNIITLDGEEGTVTVTASQAGDDSYNAADDEQLSFAVYKIEQTISLDAIPDQDVGGDPVTVITSASSGLEVSLSISGPASLSGTTITLDGTEGTVTIVANQAGDELYKTALEVSESFEVVDYSTLCDDFVVKINSIENNMCFGESLGSIDITVSGGSESFAFEWSNSASTEDLSELAAGTYSVTVTDINYSCESTLEQAITEPAAIEITSTTTDVIAGNDGSVDISVTGGTGGYNYSWSNGADTEDLNDVSGGEYTVTVTDANSCTASSTMLIGDIITGLDDVNEEKVLSVYPNPASRYLNVQMPFEEKEDCTVHILNLNGKIVLKQKFGSSLQLKEQIDISQIAAGVYALVVNTKNGNSVRKISITK